MTRHDQDWWWRSEEVYISTQVAQEKMERSSRSSPGLKRKSWTRGTFFGLDISQWSQGSVREPNHSLGKNKSWNEAPGCNTLTDHLWIHLHMWKKKWIIYWKYLEMVNICELSIGNGQQNIWWFWPSLSLPSQLVCQPACWYSAAIMNWYPLIVFCFSRLGWLFSMSYSSKSRNYLKERLLKWMFFWNKFGFIIVPIQTTSSHTFPIFLLAAHPATDEDGLSLPIKKSLSPPGKIWWMP